MKPLSFLQIITLMLLLAPPLLAQTTITNLSVINHGAAGGTSDLINADGVDENLINGPTNRHYIRAQADVTFSKNGDYIVVFDLLDPSDTVKAVVSTSFNGVTIGSSVNAQVDIPAPTAQLDALVFHRVRARALFNNGLAPPSGPYALQATATEPTGRRYRHFHSIASTDTPLHVLGEVTAVTATGSRVVFAGASALAAWPVNVDFTLRRYDRWGLFTAVSDNVAVTVEFEVRRSDGQVVPLVAGSALHTISVPCWQTVGGLKSPSAVPLTRQLLVDPSGQIDSINYTYTILARITHEDEPGTPLASAQLSSAVEKLAQFNGVVRFGDPGGVTGTVTSLAGTPTRVNPISNNAWDLNVNPGGGLLTGTTRTFGNATLRVQLQPNGEALYSDPVLKLPLSGPVPDSVTVANVTFSRGSAELGSTGLKAAVTVQLPAGCGYSTNANTTLLDTSFTVSNVTLGQNLLPTNSLVWTPGGQIFIHEETKPILYEASSLTWQTTQGKFDLGGTVTVHSVHQPYLDALDATGLPPEQRVKYSNDGYWRHVAGDVGVVAIKANAGGAARIDAQNIVIAEDKNFYAHHPKLAAVSWSDPGHITLVDDKPLPASSSLNGVNVVLMPYAQHCQDALQSCPGGAQVFANYIMSPSGSSLVVLPNGGLHASGTILGAHKLGWGRLSAGNPLVHEAQAVFNNANVMIGGHFLLENSSAASFGTGPGYIFNTGVLPSNLNTLELPETLSYSLGLADYPGMNLRASGGDVGKQMISRLGGQASDPYTLATNSKFYARWSGVSGIQQATGEVTLPTPALFGFPALISTFGLSWLSNENLLSRTDGELQIVAPANVKLPFNDLTFTCLGTPSAAGMSGGAVDRTFEYWNAPARIFGLNFVPADSCDPSAGCLALACSLSAQNVPVPLVGTLGFKPDGQITAPGQPGNCGIASEFALPSVTYVEGPQRTASETAQKYAFSPVRHAYLNTESEDDRPAGPDRVGFWNLAGKLDVPFFNNLEVHGHTSANPAAPTAELHLTGGFSSGGETFFTDNGFDSTHTGHPAGLDVTNYRSSAAHRTHAQQVWLKMFTLDYPLAWSSARRSFRGSEARGVDLLVLNVQSQVDYLDPNNADLSFGVQYEGLPRISVSNALFNAIDEKTGVASSIVDAAGQQVFDRLESGVDSFADLLSDQADRLVGEVVDALIEPGLNNFVDVVKQTAGDAVNAQQDVRAAVKAKVDEYLRPIGDALSAGGGGAGAANSAAPIMPLQNTLAGFVGTIGAPAGLVPSIDLKLGSIQNSIFAIAGNAGEVGNPLPGGAAGLLGRSGLDEFAPRTNAANLITGLVGSLAPQFQQTIQSANVFSFLDGSNAALDQIKVSLNQIRTSVQSLRDSLANEQQFLTELSSFQLQLDQVLADTLPDAFLNTLADAVQEQIDEAFDHLAENLPDQADAEAYVEGLRDQIKARVRRELRDRLMGSTAIASMRSAIRDRLQVVHLAFREAVDSGFEEINHIIRRALSAQLAQLDDSLNNYGAEINKVIKTGRVAGHAHIQDDALRELHLDARIELGLPEDDPFRFDGFFRFQQLNASGPGGCPEPGGGLGSTNFAEVTLGARNASLEWITPGMKADVSGQMGFLIDGVPIPISIGGSFEMTAGTLKFATAEVEELRGTVKVGLAPKSGGGVQLGENYLGLAAAVRISGSGLEGGLFLGRSCSLDPINLINPQLGDLLGSGGFTGGYVFGAGRIPIIDFGCLLNLSAGVGMGAFYSVPGPTWGGLAQLSASGEALCLISVRGSVDLIGLKTGDEYRFSGQGRISGKVGYCPFCKRFRKTVRFTYQGGDWDADY